MLHPGQQTSERISKPFVYVRDAVGVSLFRQMRIQVMSNGFQMITDGVESSHTTIPVD